MDKIKVVGLQKCMFQPSRNMQTYLNVLLYHSFYHNTFTIILQNC